jgi:hypothetical protein
MQHKVHGRTDHNENLWPDSQHTKTKPGLSSCLVMDVTAKKWLSHDAEF